jgi:transcriptional regulator with XRE-family HTH domain
MNLGQRISLKRVSKGLSKVELAKRVGISHIQLARYESSKSKPSTSVIQRIASVLDTSNDYLIIGIEPRHSTFNEEKLEHTLSQVKDFPEVEKWLAYDFLIALKNKIEMEKKISILYEDNQISRKRGT